MGQCFNYCLLCSIHLCNYFLTISSPHFATHISKCNIFHLVQQFSSVLTIINALHNVCSNTLRKKLNNNCEGCGCHNDHNFQSRTVPSIIFNYSLYVFEHFSLIKSYHIVLIIIMHRDLLSCYRVY